MSVVGRQPRIDFCVKALPPSKSYGLPLGRRLRTPGRKRLLKATPPQVKHFDPVQASQFTQPEVDWRTYHPFFKSSSVFVKMTPDEFLNLCQDFNTATKYEREIRRVSLVRENMKRLDQSEQKMLKDTGGVIQLIVEEISDKPIEWVKKIVSPDYVPKSAGKRLLLVTKHFGRHRALDFKMQGETLLGVKVTVVKFIGKQQSLPPENITAGDYLLREPSGQEQREKQYTPNYVMRIKPSSI
ncbi:MAG: hypothetical protein CL967_06270 [Euryarchaeota archaeon]|nr:hypothetical protein [Euryarchaeota archaeon]|tara:strand:- start:577 stop:1299 length:723 start_codon:yes stop_codon:yes gene_type:complete